MRLLVIEGNTREGRDAYRAGYGRTAGEAYADTLKALAPEAAIDIVCPTDADAALAAPLTAYDGVFVTGSSLNLYDGGPEISRQLDLARAVYRARVPFFGSCWGLQLACAAAGGRVFKNPRGREIGIARGIWLTEAGRAHPLLAGRPAVYEALCSHIDIVELPSGGTVLATNAFAPVQAAEIFYEGGVFWGVQYHPEYNFAEVAAIVERRAAALAREGLVADEAEARAYGRDLRGLDEGAAAAWRLGVGETLLTAEARAVELSNFLAARVRPAVGRRGVVGE